MPRALPLEIEVLKAWDEGDIHLEMIYFTGEIFEGEKTRVFGYLGRPKKIEGKLPGLLHIHGGGQTARPDWPQFWAKRGYVCLSFDFCGDTNLATLGPEYRRERFTLWRKVPADMMKVGGGMTMTPDPKRNPWLHWAMAARRGLTLLETQPGVNPDRVGIFGISVGGTLTWIVAGIDPRVRAAVPIYGCGWESYAFPVDAKSPASEDQKLWRAMMAPEEYAPRITAPLLFMSATNDFHGKMDLAYNTLDLLGSKTKRQVFTANYDHHIEPAEARSLPLWMDAQLKGNPQSWPAPPAIELTGGGVPIVHVAPENPDGVDQVNIYYCLNNDWPMARFWRTVATVRRRGQEFLGEAAFLDPSDHLTVFANVTYKNGIRHSSRLLKRAAASIPGAAPTLHRETFIDAMTTPTDWSWVPAYTDPNREGLTYFTAWTSDTREQGFTLNARMFNPAAPSSFYFGTRKVGDPQFRGRANEILAIDVLNDRTPETLTIILRHRLPLQYGQEYRFSPPPNGEKERTRQPWRTLLLKREQFQSQEGRILPDWQNVDWFILKGTSAPGNRRSSDAFDGKPRRNKARRGFHP